MVIFGKFGPSSRLNFLLKDLTPITESTIFLLKSLTFLLSRPYCHLQLFLLKSLTLSTGLITLLLKDSTSITESTLLPLRQIRAASLPTKDHKISVQRAAGWRGGPGYVDGPDFDPTPGGLSSIDRYVTLLMRYMIPSLHDYPIITPLCGGVA